ncbi:hypothetical protein DITRI_Ditri19aG0134000 [Diplodiscus trichospermus]
MVLLSVTIKDFGVMIGVGNWWNGGAFGWNGGAFLCNGEGGRARMSVCGRNGGSGMGRWLSNMAIGIKTMAYTVAVFGVKSFVYGIVAENKKVPA